MAAVTEPQSDKPYWDTETGGIAPIKSDYVLWHKMGKNRTLAPPTIDDDAAEGRGKAQLDQPLLRTGDMAPAAASPAATPAPTTAATTNEPVAPAPAADGPTDGPPPAEQPAAAEATTDAAGEDQPAEKKVRLSGAQKKALAKQKQKEQWEAKIAAKKEAKKAAREEQGDGATAAGATEGGEGGRQRGKGQNKNRKFDNHAGTSEFRLCTHIAQGKPCTRQNCKFEHDIATFLASRPADIKRALPTSSDDLTPVDSSEPCPVFLSLGECPYGFKCRFGESHMRKVEEGQGFMQSGWELVVDEEKVAKRKAEIGEGKAKRSERGEMNLITMNEIKAIRGGGRSQEKFPLSVKYLSSIGEPFDSRDKEDGGRGGKGKGKKRGRNGDVKAEETPSATTPEASEAAPGAEQSEVPHTSTLAMAVDGENAATEATNETPSAATTVTDTDPSRTFVPDMAPVRASEKKRLDFAGKLWMAPLTTVGNLPFRRLAVENGCDITTSEMGLAQEFLSGNANEWSLVRRHPSERIFGVQICGSKPQVLVPAAEAIAQNCEIDFLDVNCGCPIDLVFNKGAGSALLAHATKLGKSLVGMSQVLGEVPLTVKIRTGVANNQPTAHKLMPRFQKEWGVSAVTMHGRSRQQRYKAFADYKYIGECVNVLRDTVKDDDLAPIPIFGNGDAYDWRSYWDNVEQSGVDGIMIARGALIKPWIFTELKERRDWDISSRERLDMIGKLCNYGLEHWGSDQMGTNLTRRFVCESLSFTHRYVPVGLLERLPTHMNERAFPYKGRDELETLLASDQAKDWVNITSMFLGPPPDDWSFIPKHKAASTETEAQG